MHLPSHKVISLQFATSFKISEPYLDCSSDLWIYWNFQCKQHTSIQRTLFKDVRVQESSGFLIKISKANNPPTVKTGGFTASEWAYCLHVRKSQVILREQKQEHCMILTCSLYFARRFKNNLWMAVIFHCACEENLIMQAAFPYFLVCCQLSKTQKSCQKSYLISVVKYNLSK